MLARWASMTHESKQQLDEVDQHAHQDDTLVLEAHRGHGLDVVPVAVGLEHPPHAEPLAELEQALVLVGGVEQHGVAGPQHALHQAHDAARRGVLAGAERHAGIEIDDDLAVLCGVRLPARDDDELPRQLRNLEVLLPGVAPLGLGQRAHAQVRGLGCLAAGIGADHHEIGLL